MLACRTRIGLIWTIESQIWNHTTTIISIYLFCLFFHMKICRTFELPLPHLSVQNPISPAPSYIKLKAPWLNLATCIRTIPEYHRWSSVQKRKLTVIERKLSIVIPIGNEGSYYIREHLYSVMIISYTNIWPKNNNINIPDNRRGAHESKHTTHIFRCQLCLYARWTKLWH